MREIKFRAWNGDDMIYDVTFIKNSIDNTYNIIQSHTLAGVRISPYSVELMQYTGLKDNNGKDIYEGDIITTEHYICIDNGKQNYVLLVEFIDCAFCVTAYCVNNNKTGISDGICEIIDVEENYTILGNVYENPELLETK